MSFRPPPEILQKVLRSKAMQHREGKFFLWAIPAVITPVYTNLFLARLIEKEAGAKKARDIHYTLGKIHGIQTFRMVSERFGYAKKLKDKAKLLKFNSGQSEMAGYGAFKWTRIDFKNKVFIGKSLSSAFAEEYKRFFGIQKTPVDHFLRGGLTGFVECVVNEKMFAVETSCVACGKPYCEIVVKPIKDWDKKSKLFKEQEITLIVDNVKKLAAKREPYFIFKGF